MILLCYALEILDNNIINRLRTRETWCRNFARNIVSRESSSSMAGSAAVSLRESDGIAPARGLPAAERRKFMAWRRQPQGK